MGAPGFSLRWTSKNLNFTAANTLAAVGFRAMACCRTQHIVFPGTGECNGYRSRSHIILQTRRMLSISALKDWLTSRHAASAASCSVSGYLHSLTKPQTLSTRFSPLRSSRMSPRMASKYTPRILRTSSGRIVPK